MDRVSLKNIRLFGVHGAEPEEKKLGQRFEIDVDAFGDFSKPAKSDRLDDAVNYSTVFKTVERVFNSKSYNLIEALAGDIADAVLAMPVAQVTVRVRKPNAHVKGILDCAEVEITRKR
jgi:dihydroneopterin aldolase